MKSEPDGVCFSFREKETKYFPGRPIGFHSGNDAADSCSGFISIETAELLIEELKAVVDAAKKWRDKT